MPRFENVTVACPGCDGEKFCPTCGGAGQTAQPGNAVADMVRMVGGSGYKQRKCQSCRGQGTCRQCAGAGEVTQRRVVLGG